MKTVTLSILTGLMILAAGCGKQESKLSADELSKALGVSWWVVDLPEGGEGEYLSVSFRDHDQEAPDHGGAGGWPGGEAKVFIYDEAEARISYAIVGSGGLLLRGSMPNQFDGYDGISRKAPLGSPVEVGDILIKRSKVNSTDADPNTLSSEEIGLAVTISKSRE